MYISGFWWGSRSSRNYFFECENKSRCEIAEKKQCAMPSIARRFAWSRRHKFSYLRTFDRDWSSRWCFWRRLCAVWGISGSRHQRRSCRQRVSCDRVNVNKPKLRNFDRPLELPGHLQWNCYVSNVSSLRNTTVRVCGNCRCRQPRNNSRDRADVNRRQSGRYMPYLRNFNGPLRLSGRRRQCFWRRQRVISSKNDGASPW